MALRWLRCPPLHLVTRFFSSSTFPAAQNRPHRAHLSCPTEQVWAQAFKFVLPMEKPGEAAPALRAAVMNSRRLLPDQLRRVGGWDCPGALGCLMQLKLCGTLLRALAAGPTQSEPTCAGSARHSLHASTPHPSPLSLPPPVCREIGSGSAAVTSLLRGQGSEEVTIPLTDKKGNTTGALQLGVIVEMGEGAQLGEPLPSHPPARFCALGTGCVARGIHAAATTTLARKGRCPMQRAASAPGCVCMRDDKPGTRDVMPQQPHCFQQGAEVNPSALIPPCPPTLHLPAGSAAGTTLGTVHMPVGGLPETALPPASQEALLQSRQPLEPGLVDTGVSITTAPEVGPTAGVGSGQVVNPASATFGVMQ